MNPIDLQWTEHPDNPLISPSPPGLFIADPTVLLPDETPDGKWHLFANSIPPKIHEFISSDGVSWSMIRTFARGGMRAYVRHFEGCFHLFYEQIRWPVPLRSRIVHCTSLDLRTWSEPAVVIRPHLSWHGRFHRTVGNPCVIRWGNEWLLYYSAATVFLKDCGFVEPAYIGLARANCLNGPWTVMKSPLLSPDSGDSFRNMGAGAIKVVVDEERGVLWGFNNGIFRDRENHSRSAIRILRSLDGVNWEYADSGPFIFPEPGWKRALVYAMDVRRVKDEMWVYFNARDGWMVGRERIGLSVGRPVA